MRRSNEKKVVVSIGTEKLKATICKLCRKTMLLNIGIVHNKILVPLYLVYQNLGLWSTWVNLIFSILTNCNFAFSLDGFFFQKDTLALKVRKSQKEILDS